MNDSIVLAKDMEAINDLVNYLSSHFELNMIKSGYFLGLEINQDRNKSTIFPHRRGYAS